MAEALRLIGLMQDGALLPVILACAVVWMTVTVQQWRRDVAKLHDHARLGKKLETVARDVSTLRADVSGIKASLDTFLQLRPPRP